ncbi:MAG: hypothetical protein IAI50_21720 [Candidatus Eremiobacteraeota bacterium]|nr:hypothetical protein [Candidatus Eremiobacteraeota bacterium]
MEGSVREFDQGVLLGILIGEAHFGGDRTQPQITLRMHVRHGALLAWILDRCPGARLYGPYGHDGRNYFQLMIRGNALRHRLVPLLDALPWEAIDPHTYARYVEMKRRYALDVPPAADRPA